MKKIIIRSVFIFLITVFLLYYILKDNFNESIRLLVSSNFIFLGLALLVWAIFFISESLLLKILINKHKKDFSLKQSLLLNIMTKFFNGITPFSLGGQPLQVYQLSRDDVEVSDGILVITEMFVIYEITLFILVAIAISCRFLFNLTPSSFLWTLTITGLIFNTIGISLVMFISLKINTAKKVGNLIIKFLHKINIIKNEEKVLEGWANKCFEYSRGFKNIVKNKKLFAKCVLLNIFSLTLYFTIPFFTILAIDDTVNINVFYAIILTTLSFLSSTFVPIPGGSVGIEYAYVNYFTILIPDGVAITSLILWRFISYYAPMIIGGIIFNIVDNRKSIMCKEASKTFKNA